MEAKEEEFIITRKWLAEMRAYEAWIQAFKNHFPNGGEALEVLKWCGELDYRDFGRWLVDFLPPTYPPLVLNNLIGSLFYPNDVHIKGDVSTQECCIRGSFKVDGKLTIDKQQRVFAAFVNANEIDISGYAHIRHTQIKANRISLRGYASLSGDVNTKVINLKGGYIGGDVDADEIINDGGLISGDVNTKVINLKGGYIGGDVDADEIINDGGLISGDVNTFTIENINGGRVAGEITYKRSDEHK